MGRHVNRRTFLQLGGMSLALTLADQAGATRRRFDDPRLRRRGGPVLPEPGPNAQTETPLLVMIFLRGGADGLNQTIPTEAGEHTTYLDYRRTIGVQLDAIDAAGTRLLDGSGVDTQFALHPRMVDLMPLWESGQLVVLPDVHYDSGSRSHFDSQRFYENGTPWEKFTPQGWMNRHLETKPGDPSLRALALDTITPFGMRGNYPTLTFSDLGQLEASGDPTRNEAFLNEQEFTHTVTQPGPAPYDLKVGLAGVSLIDAIRAIEGQRPLPTADPAADELYPNNTTPGQGQYQYFGNRLRDLASLVKSNAFNIELAEVDLYSWDTHRDQDGAYHNHPTLSEALARGLRAFVTDLGPTYMENTVIVVMSEFGRTARENGSNGTDHGSAMATYVMGSPSKLRGRRVITDWAGLAEATLRDGRDLQHSTDFRDVLLDVVRGHLGNDSPDVFPGHEHAPVGLLV